MIYDARAEIVQCVSFVGASQSPQANEARWNKEAEFLTRIPTKFLRVGNVVLIIGGVLMPEDMIKLWDEKLKQFKSMQVKDFEGQLDNLRRIVEGILSKIKFGEYQLTKYEIGLSLKAGIIVATAEGQVTLTFELKK